MRIDDINRLGRKSVVMAAAALVLAGCSREPVKPIPRWWGACTVPDFVGAAAEARPLEDPGVPQHPFMADSVSGTMHADAFSSGAHRGPGPLGIDPVVASSARGLVGGECATVVFDSRGRLVTVCGDFEAFTLLLLDPVTLEELASYRLPPRPSTKEALHKRDLQIITTDTSGGAYFYLDEQGRVVLATSDRKILRIAIRDRDSGPAFEVEDSWDLAAHVPADCWTPENKNPQGPCDAVTAVLPDWQGRLWWVTRLGTVGTLDPETGDIRTTRLEGGIQNSFSVARDLVVVVSNEALYGLTADQETGEPVVAWREAYERGKGPKPGAIDLGSGTTPTLFGPDQEYVAIADNADPRINVLVFRRQEGEPGVTLVCKEPVFEKNRSATDNSLIGFGRSVIVENNYGYKNFLSLLFGKASAGGLARIDIDEDEKGCRTAWTSSERSPSTVPKLSTESGLVYLYTKDPQPWLVDAWYLTALDFGTGKTVFKVLTGTGWGYDNHWAPITLGPDGTAYVGVLNGIVAVRDGPG
jgi:hypothetical protein